MGFLCFHLRIACHSVILFTEYNLSIIYISYGGPRMNPLTTEEIKNAFYVESGIYHTNIMELEGYDNRDSFVNETILNMLHDNEVRFVLDDSTIDHSTAFLLYRKGRKLLMEYMFKENSEYEFQLDFCEWVYPKVKMLSIQEKADLAFLLKEQSSSLYLPIQVVSLLKKPLELLLSQSEKDKMPISEIQGKRVIRNARLLRYEIILFMVLAFLFAKMTFGTYDSIFISIGVAIFLIGLYLLLGYLLHFRHVYCFHQLSNREEMTPNEIYWESVRPSYRYGQPILFMVAGIALIVLGILGLLSIIPW